jgi:hypothetical protein
MMAVLDRAAKDQRFNWRMMTDPDSALSQFDLTPQEIDALKSCDRARLVDCGLDERLVIWIPWRHAPLHAPSDQ